MPEKGDDTEEDSFFRRHEFLMAFLYFFIFLFFLIAFFQSPFEEKVIACGDGTLYNSCSLTKPYYCDNGSLVEKASLCGCLGTRNIESCNNSFQTVQKNITLSSVLDGKQNEFNFTVYKGVEDYLSTLPRFISYNAGEAPSRENFSLKEINDEQQKQFLMPLVIEIENMSNNKDDQARIAISIVQNIPYGFSNKTTGISGVDINYSRYPYEVLYDSQGVCGEKSELMAFLLKEIGYDVVLFYYPKENHEAIGIKCPIQDSYKRTGYCFVETTGPAIISDSSIEYVGGVKLTPDPEIIPISSGISLGPGLAEYSDAKMLELIRQGFPMLFRNANFERLKEKYGLTDYYYIQ